MAPSSAPAGGALPPVGTAVLLALSLAIFSLGLGKVPLVGPDEPRYSRVAVEMQRAGEWVTPTLQGEPWLEKPPLFYWLAGASTRLFGENEIAFRIPSVLAAVLAVGLTALFGARLHGSGAGLHAGFVLATSLLFFAYGHAASMDMLLAATTAASIGFIGLRVLGVAGPGALIPAYALAGLATLAKGPLGVALPVLVLLTYSLFTRSLAPLRRSFSWLGITVFLIVAAPWHAAIYRDQGGHFVDVFLLNHNLQRFASEIHNHPGGPLYYVIVLIAGVLPWTGLLLPTVGSTHPRRNAADAYLLAWVVAPLVFFSAAGSKLPGYILPCLPALAILMGRAADDLVRGVGRPRFGLGPRSMAVVTLVVCAAAAAALPAGLRSLSDPGWRTVLPLSGWLLITGWMVSRQVSRSPAAALHALRVGACGLAVLIVLAAPAILERRESGRGLFAKTGGREVLAYGAWRTSWMAGYFYNDGKVREATFADVIDEIHAKGDALVLCGATETRDLRRAMDFTTEVVAEGPRGNQLLRIKAE